MGRRRRRLYGAELLDGTIKLAGRFDSEFNDGKGYLWREWRYVAQ